jgi:hypothetical protein
MAKPTPFSHSSLKSYEQCAMKHYHEKVLKRFPFTDTVHTIYGKELHKAAEDFMKDDVPIPERFAFMQPTLDALKAKPGRKLCEHEMGMTVDGQPCGFKSSMAWARGIADLLIVDDDALTAWCVDYKSGNNKYPDTDQLDLMSLLVFANFPHIRQVKGALLFVVKDTMIKKTVVLEQAEGLVWDYRERVARLEASFENGIWNPKPSGLCRKWCPVTECLHNGNH